MTEKIVDQLRDTSNPPPNYPFVPPVPHAASVDTYMSDEYHLYPSILDDGIDFRPSLQVGGGRRYISPPVEVTPTRLRTRIRATERDTGIVREAESRRAQLAGGDAGHFSGDDTNPFLDDTGISADYQLSSPDFLQPQYQAGSEIPFERHSSPLSESYDMDDHEILDRFLETSSDMDIAVQELAITDAQNQLRANLPFVATRLPRPTSEVPPDTRAVGMLAACPPRRAISCDPSTNAAYPHMEGLSNPLADLPSMSASDHYENQSSSTDENNLPNSVYQVFGRHNPQDSVPASSTPTSSHAAQSSDQFIPDPTVPGFFHRNKNSRLAALLPNKHLAPPSALERMGFVEESMDRDTLLELYPRMGMIIPPTPAKPQDVKSNEAAKVAEELFPELEKHLEEPLFEGVHNAPESEEAVSDDHGKTSNLPTAVGRRSFETNQRLQETFLEINTLMRAVESETAIPSNQILDLWMKQYHGRTMTAANLWNIYLKFHAQHTEQELARLPPKDRPQSKQQITPKIRGLCFEQFKLKYLDWQERLKLFDEITQCDEAPQTVQQRASEFSKIFKKISSLLEYAETRFGFLGILLMCGNVVNQDASLGELYTARDLKDFFPVRFLAGTDAVLGHAKAHAYNQASLRVAQEAATQRDHNAKPVGNIFQTQPATHHGTHSPEKRSTKQESPERLQQTTSRASLSPEKRSTHQGSPELVIQEDSPEHPPPDAIPSENLSNTLKNTLREAVEKLGVDFPKGKLFPWMTILGILAKGCSMAIGWPEECPMPGEHQGAVNSKKTNKGLSGLTNVHRYALLGALNNKTLKFVTLPKHQWQDLVASAIPVIQGVAPDYDSPHARGRLMFANGVLKREGLARLPRSAAATRVRPSGSRNKNQSMEVLNLVSDDEPQPRKVTRKKNLKVEVVIPVYSAKNAKGKGREVIHLDQSSEAPSGSEYQEEQDELVDSDYETGETAQKRKAKSAGNAGAAKKRVPPTNACRGAEQQPKVNGKPSDEAHTKLSVKRGGKQTRICSPMYIESDSDDQLIESGITTEASARPKPKPLVQGSAAAIKREIEIEAVLGPVQPQARSQHTSTEARPLPGQLVISTRPLSKTLSPSPTPSSPSPKRVVNPAMLSLNPTMSSGEFPRAVEPVNSTHRRVDNNNTQFANEKSTVMRPQAALPPHNGRLHADALAPSQTYKNPRGQTPVNFEGRTSTRDGRMQRAQETLAQPEGRIQEARGVRVQPDVRSQEVLGQEVRGQEVRAPEGRIQEARVRVQPDIRSQEVRGHSQEVFGHEVRGQEVRAQEAHTQDVRQQEVRGLEIRAQEVRTQDVRHQEVRGQAQEARTQDTRHQEARNARVQQDRHNHRAQMTRDSHTQQDVRDMRVHQDPRNVALNALPHQDPRNARPQEDAAGRVARNVRGQQDSAWTQQEARPRQNAPQARAIGDPSAQALANARALIKAHEEAEARLTVKTHSRADSRASNNSQSSAVSQRIHGFNAAPSSAFNDIHDDGSLGADYSFENTSGQLTSELGYSQTSANIYPSTMTTEFSGSFQHIDQYNDPSFYHAGAGSSQPEPRTSYAPLPAPPPYYVPESSNQSSGGNNRM
ncbi:hypothetical protein BJ138DRAFT_1230018 [Hygrophoropsis aurantiaca]|uniref:Uncharacterized protein n=1 Tax=Hygrophoropsis aurantiaca TaxID=72124 RepID=A0ACB7ZW05_9AGAM|nr:hypothetical protein BJ138DRAFT_1230018 [Hygrophoropsis aurantiaca]